MDLTFVQTSNMFGRDGAWETEFSVDQEFNLHLERESSGKIIMMQKTAGTFFDIVKDFDMKSGDVVYDYDSASFLGTKTIKIVSESAIRFASLTTSGEVTEIKSQSKEIEVTSNGTTEVTPDAGFAYLNSVKVKTNVPTSGEGSGGEGGGSNYIYYDQTRTVLNVRNAWKHAVLLKIDAMGLKAITTPLYVYKMFEDAPEGFDLGSFIVAVCIDLNLRIDTPDFSGTIDEMVIGDYIREVSITEEEFYTL